MGIRSAAATAIGVLVTAGLAVGLGGESVSSAATPAADSSSTAVLPVQDVHWGRCSDPSLREVGAECGRLVVPLDHDDPTGPKISLAVSRKLHTKGPFRGAIFTNPGGPGGAGTYLAGYGQYVPDKVGLTYDWYGMDPRGVGASRPALSCDGQYFPFDRPDYVPSTARRMHYWRKKSSGYAKDCGSSAARRLLPHMRTVDNVADFEALRKSIGVEKITFYGFSYGTYIAEVYATLHPRHIKAMVLDGVIDPQRVFYRSNLDQDRAFQRTVRKFFVWVAKYHRTYHLGTSGKAVYRTYRHLRAKLARHPAAGKVGPDELDDALLPAAYYNLTWLDVGKAFSDLANKGKAAGIIASYRGSNPVGKGSDNGYAVYLATECTDAPWPDHFSTYRRDNWRTAEKAPFYTWGNGWFNAPCRVWPAASGRRVRVTGAGFHAPVLLVSETLDPATPYAGALKTRKIFPSSRLVAGVGGTSHAVSLFGVACTDNTIADLLRNGRLPKRKHGSRADKTCKPLAPPDPSTAGGRSVSQQRVPQRLPTGIRW